MEIYHHSNYGSIFEQNCKSIPVLKPINDKYILPTTDYGGDIDLLEHPLDDSKEKRD